MDMVMLLGVRDTLTEQNEYELGEKQVDKATSN